jgi:hypothetical protein
MQKVHGVDLLDKAEVGRECDLECNYRPTTFYSVYILRLFVRLRYASSVVHYIIAHAKIEACSSLHP